MSSLIMCIVSFLCNVNVAFLSAEAQRKEFFGSKCVFIAFLFVLCKVVKMETSPSKRQPLAPASPGGRRFAEPRCAGPPRGCEGRLRTVEASTRYLQAFLFCCDGRKECKRVICSK